MKAIIQTASYDGWQEAMDHSTLLERQGLDHTVFQNGEKFSVVWAQLDDIEKPINTPAELKILAGELSESFQIEKSQEWHQPEAVIKAKSLAQHSTNEYSIVIPDGDRTITVDGGQWVPAFVYIDNPNYG